MSQKSHSAASSGESSGDVDERSNGPQVQPKESFIPEVASIPEEEAYVSIEDGEKKGGVRVPALGWIVFGGLLVCVLAIVFLGLFKSPSLEQEAKEVKMVVEANKKEDQEEVEQKAVRQLFQELTACVSGYYSSGQIEDRLQYVRHPKRVRPLMEDHYSKYNISTGEFVEFENYSALELDGVPFVYARVRFKHKEAESVLLEQMSDGSFKVDWESNVQYLPVTWHDYVYQRPTKALVMRVFVQPDNFYVYEFRDNQMYDCYKLTSMDSDEYIFGFVEKGSVASLQLRQFFLQARRVSQVKSEPMILLLRFPEDSMSKNCVHIDRVMAPRWVFVRESDADTGMRVEKTEGY
ncbi:MAG: hypothetical protein ACPH9O_04415 [Akkermansiaceae bacterium]